ncbi:hypothetical protein [Rugosimonospora africana]|nr:hypothetical protein [Rugosimonospora africana]
MAFRVERLTGTVSAAGYRVFFGPRIDPPARGASTLGWKLDTHP